MRCAGPNLLMPVILLPDLLLQIFPLLSGAFSDVPVFFLLKTMFLDLKILNLFGLLSKRIRDGYLNFEDTLLLLIKILDSKLNIMYFYPCQTKNKLLYQHPTVTLLQLFRILILLLESIFIKMDVLNGRK